MEELLKKLPDKFGRRLLMSVAGIILTGVSVGGLQKAGLGVDPCTAMVTAFANLFHTTYAAAYPVINAILLVAAFFIYRKLIGIATVINMAIAGICASVTRSILDLMFPTLGFAGRIILILVILIDACFSASLYYTADLGVSSYDAVALTLSGKFKLSSFRVCRVCCDLTCCLLGFLNGVTLGCGTIITAFMMGPVIQWFNTHVTEKWLK